MKHKGLHQHRFADNLEEQRFAEAWEAANSPPLSYGTLAWLLGDGGAPVWPTAQERAVAATVVQWLGSPVGQCFLRDLGYVRKL